MSLIDYKSVDPQSAFNQGGNHWIIKPSGLSRGRGIHISNEINDIMHYLSCSDAEFVCQKYMENAMLLDKRRVEQYDR